MGHLYRALALARALKEAGRRVEIVLRTSHGPAIEVLRRAGVSYFLNEEQLAWEATVLQQMPGKVWINDRLNTDENHVRYLKQRGLVVVSLDDQGAGANFVDLNICALSVTRNDLVRGARVLAGLQYLILSAEIERFRRLRDRLDSVVINLGGSDTHGVTPAVTRAVVAAGCKTTIILGPGFEHFSEMAEIPTIDTVTIKTGVPSLVEEFSSHDLAVTGGGMTAFEAAAAGLPTVTVANELHEIDHCTFLEKIGCSRYAGFRKEFQLQLPSSSDQLARMSERALISVPCNGLANVCRELFALEAARNL